MKRTLSLTLIVLLLLATFTACGNGTDPGISHGNPQEDASPGDFDSNSTAPEQT